MEKETNQSKPIDEGDSKFTWVGKLGQYSHAERVDRPGRTICGLKIGKRWAKAKGVGHPLYSAKCGDCAAAVKHFFKTRRRVWQQR